MSCKPVVLRNTPEERIGPEQFILPPYDMRASDEQPARQSAKSNDQAGAVIDEFELFKIHAGILARYVKNGPYDSEFHTDNSYTRMNEPDLHDLPDMVYLIEEIVEAVIAYMDRHPWDSGSDSEASVSTADYTDDSESGSETWVCV